jgi:mannose/fructose/N-acetylgalactosamine-specific phosphotransferase system component IIC
VSLFGSLFIFFYLSPHTYLLVISLRYLCLSDLLYVYMSVCLPVHPSIYPSHLSSICLSVYLSVYLSICIIMQAFLSVPLSTAVTFSAFDVFVYVAQSYTTTVMHSYLQIICACQNCSSFDFSSFLSLSLYSISYCIPQLLNVNVLHYNTETLYNETYSWLLVGQCTT